MLAVKLDPKLKMHPQDQEPGGNERNRRVPDPSTTRPSHLAKFICIASHVHSGQEKSTGRRSSFTITVPLVSGSSFRSWHSPLSRLFVPCRNRSDKRTHVFELHGRFPISSD